jgi:antitoxin (DNA-binding transcriptional repressor) of toxin-antitoxin stability system
MKSVRLSEITGSLSDYAREGLSEPVVVTRQGRPLVAVMPLTRFDDWESVSVATNAKFMEIIERSRASARERGTVPLAEVRRKLAVKRAASRRRKKRR